MSNETIRVEVFRATRRREKSSRDYLVGETIVTPETAAMTVVRMLIGRGNVAVRIEELGGNTVTVGYGCLYHFQPELQIVERPLSTDNWFLYRFTPTFPAYSYDVAVLRDMLTAYALSDPTLCAFPVYLYTTKLMAARRRTSE